MKIIDKELKKYLETAIQIAREGGDVLRNFFGKVQHIHDKKNAGDLVTEADIESDCIIRNALQEAYPTHSILTEESGRYSRKESDFLWIVDPLDGTTNYAHCFPFFSVSIALLYQKELLVGVVYNPISQELFHAVRGGGAFLGEEPIAVSRAKDLEHSLLATGFPYDRRQNSDNNYKEFTHLTHLTQGVRRLGSAALDLAYVACGRLDGYWERGIKAWDIAAGVLLVQESGGKVSGYEENQLDIFSSEVLATNGYIHSLLSRELQQVRDKK
jgi:myo-inositol-1(or 4)-monophosphatase